MSMSTQEDDQQTTGSRASRLRTAVGLASMPGVVILVVGLAGRFNPTWWLNTVGEPGVESISPVVVAGFGASVILVVTTAVTGVAYIRLDGPIGFLPGQEGAETNPEGNPDRNLSSDDTREPEAGNRNQGGLESLDSVADLFRGPQYRNRETATQTHDSSSSVENHPAGSHSGGSAPRDVPGEQSGRAGDPETNSANTSPDLINPTRTIAQPSDSCPPVAVLACGGALSASDDDPAEMLSRSSSVSDYIDPLVREVSSTPGFDLAWQDILTAADVARTAVKDVDGVVVAGGVDGLADAAYAMDLLTDLSVPVIFTGSQRSLDAHDSDLGANLVTAGRAASEEAFDPGVHVAFDGEIHAARDVIMQHTSALSAFESPTKGPVAVISQEGTRLRRAPGRGVAIDPLRLDAGDAESIPEIPIVHSGIGVGANPVRRALVGNVGGLVVDGTGFGNTTAPLGEALETAAEEVPVVVSSRCQSGRTAPAYSQPGGGQRLTDSGALLAGDLSASKARVGLALARAADLDSRQLAALFG